ncbi:unnamed protein product [Bathycoccus prasinos]
MLPAWEPLIIVRLGIGWVGVEAFGSVSVLVSVPILAPFNSFVYVFSPYELSVQVKATVVSVVAKVCPSKITVVRIGSGVGSGSGDGVASCPVS